MILLSGHTLTPLKKIDPEKLSLSLKERDSTATLTYADMGDIGITSWFLDDTEPGQGIVWRVKGFQQMYDQRTGQVNLEHVINTLKDFILFGEITPAIITGHDDAEECEARQAIEYILRRQRDWVLGDFDASYEHVHNNYSFNGNSLYDALNDISSTLEDAWWSYDMSSYPFQINITKKNDTVVSELRPGRNIKTISKTVDKTNMYTRFYPIGYDDLHISGEYVSKNESLYGVFEKVETDTSKETEADLINWANIKLDRHAEPRVTITVDGLELADATGESLDRLTLGRMCRIPLAEFGTTLTERITELSYSDKIHQRESVTVTLSNTSEDVMQFLADEIKDGSGPSGGGSRTNAVQQKEDHAWFEDTDEHVAMVAEGIVGYDEDGNPDWGRLSQFIVDGEGIHGNVHTIIDGILTNQSTLDMTESRVSVVVDANGNVKPAEIVAGINGQSGSFIRLSADTIDIDGLISALTTKSLTVASMTMTTDAYMLGNMTYQFMPVTWQSCNVRTVYLSSAYYFEDYLGTQVYGRLVTGYSDTTINYLGGPDT